MEDRSHLHDTEQLLCSMHASTAALLRAWLRSLLDAVIATAVLSLLFLAISYFFFQSVLPWYVLLLIFLISLAGTAWRRYTVWHHASFRITSERILMQSPYAFFHSDMRTVKWPQYQESHAGHRTFLDFLFRARPLHVRFGTADAMQEATFPSIIYAEDLKHYMDKVDSAYRKNEMGGVRPFVPKPRGKRDEYGN